MKVNLRETASKPQEYKVGEDGVILYREATPKDRDAASFAAFRDSGKTTEGDRYAEHISALLGRCVLGWSGFVDAEGNAIPFDRSLVDALLDAVGERQNVINLVLGVGGASQDPLPETGSKPSSASPHKKNSTRRRATADTQN